MTTFSFWGVPLSRLRHWITPLTAGSALLLSVTGVLMFFHLDSGLNKAAHEWLSWAFLAGLGLHLSVNASWFMRHLHTWAGRIVLGSFIVVLAASFIPAGKPARPSFAAPMKALAQAPLSVVAQVAQVDFAELQKKLAAKGLKAERPEQSIRDLVGEDLKTQIRALNAALGRAPITPP